MGNETNMSYSVAENKTFNSSSFFSEEYLSGARSVQFIMCCLFAGIIIDFGSKKFNFPYTVSCFIFGACIGLLDLYSKFIHSFTLVARMNPSDIMLLFLPFLVFESSFNMNPHMFKKALPQSLVVAIPGTVFCSVLNGVFAKYTLSYYNWSWLTSFLFGSIVSASDPVAVVDLLHEMRMPHSFIMLVESESLLNDGISILLYEKLSYQIISPGKMNIAEIIWDFIKTSIGAPLIGYFFGKISDRMLQCVYISPVSEMSMTLIMAYITYFVAEYAFGVSSVLAVLLFGMTLSANKMSISPESENLIQIYWKILNIFANTLIFVFAGVIISVYVAEYHDLWDTIFILITYFGINIIRFLMVIIFYPILYWTGYSLTYQESIILAWSGLRSGFCLTLALLVAFDPEFPESENASKILVQVSGVIVLTLLVNANTVKLMMKLLRFKQLTFVDRLSMGNALISATDIRDKSIRGCKRDWKYGRADWNWLLQKTCMHDPYKGGLYGDESCMSSLFLPYGTCHECVDQTLPYEPNENELIQLKVASCCRVLRALKGNLLKQFRKGLIQRRTLKLLCTAIDSTSDTPYLYLRTKDIIKLVKIKSLVSSLAMKTSEWIELLELPNLPLRSIKQLQRSESHNRLRRISVWLYFKWWFEPLTNIIIFLNLLQLTAHFLCLYFYILKNICDKYQTQIRIFTFLFALFYVFETFIMILALNWGCFFKYKRNIFDLLISCIAVLDGFTDFFIMTYYPNKHSIYNHVRIVIILRLRICYVSRVLLQKCLSVIRHLASVHLYYSYDLGRGFLFANEHVLKNIETIVDFKPCAKEASEICIENIKELLEMLMDLEEKHPTIAVALKTNRAARGSLNRVKAVLDGLKGKSDISGHGIQELHKMHFEMTKSIAFAPRTRKIVKDVPSVLEAVDWIRNSQMLQIINENHIVLGFKEGDVIQDYQDNHSAIFVIARGIVKVTGRKSDMKNINIYNQLPNSDTYDMFKEKGKSQVCEYLTSSRTIGLLGYLQQTKSVTAAVCENDCEMIQIETSFLKNAERENKHLIYCMWRSAALNVAAVILKSQRRYINCADDILDARLHRGILPDMQEITNLDIPSVIDDMILVQGRAKDVSTSVIFNGPTYIQNSYRNLILLDDVIKRPPVIIVLFPDEKYDFSVCNHWTNVAEIGCSNICHKHNCNKSL